MGGGTPKIALCAVKTPGMTHAAQLTPESAAVASVVLRENHSDYHIFTTEEEDKGVHLHNHLVHHSMTLFALGASPDTIYRQHKRNTLYQRSPPKLPEDTVVKNMSDPAVFKECLGEENHYLDFVHFFEKELSEIGYPAVLQKYLVGGDEIANDILPRMYMGYVHSIMHVGLAVEFQQPSIMAEGFAQAAVHHDYWYTSFLTKADTDAKQALEPAMSLSECVDACRADPVVRECSSIDYQRQFEGEKFVMRKEMIKDGVVAKAGPELGRIAARYRVDPNDLDRATAELINTAIYAAAGAQLPPHECRYDFFLIHGTNASIWHSAFLTEPSLTAPQKARLLEYTGRVVLMLYAGMGCPEPRMDYVMSQKPKVKDCGWSELFERACLHEDDGHMCKLIRALAHGQKVSELYDHLPEFRVKQNMFLPAANAAIDSASAKPMDGTIHYDFVRGAAWPEAWEQVPIRV